MVCWSPTCSYIIIIIDIYMYLFVLEYMYMSIAACGWPHYNICVFFMPRGDSDNQRQHSLARTLIL